MLSKTTIFAIVTLAIAQPISARLGASSSNNNVDSHHRREQALCRPNCTPDEISRLGTWCCNAPTRSGNRHLENLEENEHTNKVSNNSNNNNANHPQRREQALCKQGCSPEEERALGDVCCSVRNNPGRRDLQSIGAFSACDLCPAGFSCSAHDINRLPTPHHYDCGCDGDEEFCRESVLGTSNVCPSIEGIHYELEATGNANSASFSCFNENAIPGQVRRTLQGDVDYCPRGYSTEQVTESGYKCACGSRCRAQGATDPVCEAVDGAEYEVAFISGDNWACVRSPSPTRRVENAEESHCPSGYITEALQDTAYMCSCESECQSEPVCETVDGLEYQVFDVFDNGWSCVQYPNLNRRGLEFQDTKN